MPVNRIWCFSNNKPWVTSELKILLNENKKRVFGTQDKEKLRIVQKELKREIRKSDGTCRRKLEKRLELILRRSGWV